MPPHSLLLGHLPVIRRVLAQLPPDAHPLYIPDQLRRTFPDLGPIYYLDLWPLAPSMLVTASPHTLYQIAQERPLPKYPQLKRFLGPLTDALDLVTMEGATWKFWRGVFNPGFSAQHLMGLVPGIVREAQTFAELLGEHAEKGDMIRMKRLTDNLALDVIGTVVL